MDQRSLDAGRGNRRRWVALIVLCLGVLMIVIDTTVVNVALPLIRQDLGFSQTSLVWVVNAYVLTYGGCLLLGGRLGDLYGHRRLFLRGIALFTMASLACGLASTRDLFVAARAVQGLAAAVIQAVALSLITQTFTDSVERAKAMGVYGFICATGGTIGVLFGGAVAGTLNWHWIFLINCPVGVVACALSVWLLPHARAEVKGARLDIWGAVTITASLMLVVWAIVGGNEEGWMSARTAGLLAGAAGLLVTALILEARVPEPLIPLHIFRLRSLTISSTVRLLWAAGVSGWTFISALYLQRVLGYGPMEIGLAYLPANVIAAVFALGLSARFVARFGIRVPLVTGLLLGATGLALLARAPLEAEFMKDVLPSMVLVGLGGGIAFNPLLLAAMRDVTPGETGLASGILNTAALVGGALGVAILATLSSERSAELVAAGATAVSALAGGYQVSLLVGAIGVAAGAVVGAAFLRVKARASGRERADIAAPAVAGQKSSNGGSVDFRGFKSCGRPRSTVLRRKPQRAIEFRACAPHVPRAPLAAPSSALAPPATVTPDSGFAQEPGLDLASRSGLAVDSASAHRTK